MNERQLVMLGEKLSELTSSLDLSKILFGLRKITRRHTSEV